MSGKTGAFLMFGVIALLSLTNGCAQARMRLDRMRLAADQEPPQQSEPARATATARYQACLGDAVAAHDASWAAACKRIGDKDRQDYDNCLSKLNLPKAYCDSSYKLHDAAPGCTLPGAVASVLDAELEQARSRCLRDKAAASW